ncbi:MAG TPA: HEAT repeat domain-containing protein, partial [Polyangiaceae bacterium]|nr:HEAT repeat domain-containing protein [Polyangiaceae bacterium]
MNNAFPSEDGNFKRGAFKPIAIVLVIALVAGGAAFAFMGAKTEAQSLSKEDVNKEILDIQVLPKADQLPRWRKWADAENEPRLQQEAFVHLAWAKDKESVPSMIKALGAIDHSVRGTAATALADIGSPDADAARPALLKALGEADSADKPQISWSLV